MPKDQAAEFIKKIRADFPDLTLKSGSQDYWSPGTSTITYDARRGLLPLQYGLLHELAHALLGHRLYESDFELLKLEAEAWRKAASLGKKYGVHIREDHIQNCLDTYRDWLHHRSACPKCGAHVLQVNDHTYRCFNCQTQWQVTSQRFVRSYRRLFKPKTA